MLFSRSWLGVTLKLMDSRELVKRARQAADNAYVAYSKAPKGAALLAQSGRVYAAACVDSAAYSACICAEAAALATAVGEGEREFTRLALAPHRLPCGVCLQALREFGLKLEIVSEDSNGNLSCYELQELLPMSFGPDHLKAK
jgi:cytidine deaminase